MYKGLSRNPKKFLRRFVTVDETWTLWYTPETKEQWRSSNSEDGEDCPISPKYDDHVF